MKANEAPEKIYIPTILVANVVRYKEEGSIEYVRTDAFIERALKWYCLDCECNDNCNADHKCFFRHEYKRYLAGDNNAIPPKFVNAILPDEGAAKNYRYRHFIRKMQDAFIKKACEWLKENKDHPFIGCEDPCLSGYLTDEFIEDFRTYMEGE